MKRFTGKSGRTFVVSVNLGTIRQIRDELGIDPLGTGEEAERLLTDPETLGDALSIFCQESIVSAGLDAEGFANELAGEPLFRATESMAKGLWDFFRQAGAIAAATRMDQAARLLVAATTPA